MRFWDSSALVPLFVDEPSSEAMRQLARPEGTLFVWWAAEVECVSAIARRERDGALDRESAALALERLRSLREGWTDIEPTDTIRRNAVRLVRSHPLRAAAGLQLAAALAATEGDPRSLPFVTLDERLRDAAEREGLRVEP